MRVKIQDIVEHLSPEMRRALDEAVREVIPGVEFDSSQLLRAFKRAVGRKCSTWEHVPERLVHDR